MAGEIEPSNASAINQLLVGAGIFITAGGTWLWQYLKGRSESPRKEHILIEEAEIADMRPIRELLPLVRDLSVKMDRAFSIEQEIKSDFDERFKEIALRLEKIDREQEFQRRMQEREERRGER